MTNAPTPAGMAERLMQEFYLSSAYDPKAARPADTVQAAIAFALAALAPVAAEGGEKDKLRIAVEALERLKSGRSSTTECYVIARQALSALRTEPTGGEN